MMDDRDLDRRPFPSPIIVMVSSECTAGLIGKGGACIGEIQDKSGAKIDICKRRDLKEKPILVHGTDDAKKTALEMIIANLRENPAYDGYDGRTDSFWIAIPTCTTGTVVGSQGSTIMKVQSGTGCKIDVEKERFKGKLMVNVHLKGEESQIIDAALQIDEVIKYCGKESELEEAYDNITYLVKRSREGESGCGESHGRNEGRYEARNSRGDRGGSSRGDRDRGGYDDHKGKGKGGGSHEYDDYKGKGKGGGSYDDWWYWMGPSDWWSGKGWGKGKGGDSWGKGGDSWGGKGGDAWGGKGGDAWGDNWGSGDKKGRSGEGDNKRGRSGEDEYRPTKREARSEPPSESIPIQVIMDEREVSTIFQGNGAVNMIGNTTGAVIDVDKQSYRGKKGMAISGKHHEKQGALDMILEKVEEKNGPISEAEFFIPEDYVKVVIGRGGRNISEIEQGSGTTIKMSKVGSGVQGEIPGSIQIKGTREGICTAISRIDDAINDGQLQQNGTY